MKITANSLSAQIDQLNRAFQAVEATGKKFETLERKASAILYSALHQVYEFGENLLTLKSQPGTNIIREFFLGNDVAYNSKTQANPYIGLVKLAFRAGNASSHSQYATVLGYAASLQIAAADFPAWLNERKIEGWRTAALDAQNSNARNIRNQGRLTKVQNAVAVMDAKPASALVSLPAGVQAPEGYALVLARIDANNGAQIVEVVHSSAEKVEPILLGLVDGPTAVSTEPLAPFFRAIDLIINTTPDATMGNQRDLLVRNLTLRGKQTTQIEAICEAYSFPGASMSLEGHVGELPEDTAWVLSSADARFLLGQFDKLTNWTLDSAGSITADAMPAGIQMVPMTDPQTYRVAQALPCPDKPLAAPLSALRDVAGYIAHQREENAEKNRTRAEKKAFSASVELSIQNDKLSIRLPSTILTAGLGETSAETDFGDKTIAANDIENLAATLARHDADAHGWIMDSKDVDDAALVLEAHFGNDVLRIVMPTQTGSDYNQVCEALAL